MKRHWLMLLVVAVAGGCATRRSPPDLAPIAINLRPSARVLVERGWLTREHGEIFVVGEVAKQLGNPDTTGTHLDVRLLDSAGKVLREEAVEFMPRQIPRGHRMHRHSSFHYRLDPLPLAVVRIEIAAHDEAHPSALPTKAP